MVGRLFAKDFPKVRPPPALEEFPQAFEFEGCGRSKRREGGLSPVVWSFARNLQEVPVLRGR